MGTAIRYMDWFVGYCVIAIIVGGFIAIKKDAWKSRFVVLFWTLMSMILGLVIVVVFIRTTTSFGDLYGAVQKSML